MDKDNPKEKQAEDGDRQGKANGPELCEDVYPHSYQVKAKYNYCKMGYFIYQIDKD